MRSRAGGRLPVPARAPGVTLGASALTAVITALALFLSAGFSQAHAERKSAVLVVDANTGRTLHASAADEPRYPASLTKMMTLYMVFELIERGRLAYNTPIRVSAHAAAAAPSKIDLKEGEEIALIDAIRVLITKSANDVAIAVAEHIGGSEANFARLMTQKAHQIGMRSTTFRNASGLPDPAQVTTARDMATLALRLQDEFPQHYVLFGTRTFAYKGESYRNHNTLLFHYQGTDGIKTGYTRASGFNLVSSVKRGNKHVIGVVFGGASASLRDNAMRTYLNMGLVRASPVRTRRPAPVLMARAPRPAVRQVAALPEAPPQAEAPANHSPESNVKLVRVKPMPLPEERTAPEVMPLPRPQPVLATRARPQPVASGPGTPPSSLEAQAERLAAGRAPVPVAVPVAVPARHAKAIVTDDGVHLQVGAFPSVQEAERQLAAVKSRVPAMLANAKALTQSVQQGEKTLYRARYAGLDASAATEACNALKSQGVACMVFRTK